MDSSTQEACTESFGPARQVGFGFIWAGLVVFSLASLRQARKVRRARQLREVTPGTPAVSYNA